ncbi:thioesterase family protein [Marinospirillum sp. MEB164]|uniref:Thioesterase family protein n=1 Tax=Marinospirillum alkalitolerans TaxID=3123374 RepID=A0ABW8PZQ7_9GAMM
MARIKLDFPEPVIFQTQIGLRISDINYGQHLGHDTLVSLLHEGRCQWLAQAGYTEINLDGCGLVVAELAVNYRAEGFYPQELTLELSLGELSSKGAEVYHRLSNAQGDLLAIAKVGLVFFDYQTRRPVAVPAGFLSLAQAR